MSYEIDMHESADLKLDLLINGVRIDSSINKIDKEFKSYSPKLFYHHRRKLDKNELQKIPSELVLPYEFVVDVRMNDTSPYVVKYDERDDKIFIEKNGEYITEIWFPPKPEYYDKVTSTGKKMSEVSTVLGLDLFSFILFNDCDFWKTKDQCWFCNIGYANKQFEKYDPTPQEIAEAFYHAVRDKNVKIEHVCCTTGTKVNGDLEVKKLIETLELMKEYLPWNKFRGVFLISPIENEIYIEKLADLKIENIGLSREVGNEEIFKRICPGKSKLEERFYNTIKKGVEELGWGHVEIAFISSLEPMEDTIKKCEELASMGCVPAVSVFRPSIGSRLASRKTWDKEYHKELYLRIRDIQEEYDVVQNYNNRPVNCERCYKSSLVNESWMGAFD